MLPRIVSGTSSGSMFAALFCCRTNEELQEILTPEFLATKLNPFEATYSEIILRIFREGVMFDLNDWREKCRWLASGDLTFLEAFHKTGRILNVTVSSKANSPPMSLNHVSAPNIVVWSALLASAAIPGLVRSVSLCEKLPDGSLRDVSGGRLWRDGSFEHDIPMNALSETFRAKFFVVSQMNPHISPFFYWRKGESGAPSPWRSRTGGWRGGFLLSTFELLLKEHMKMLLRVLQALELLPKVLGQDWSYLFLQQFSGDVTLSTVPPLRDYLKLISDPGERALSRYIHEGQQILWQKYSMIRNRLCIDNKLHELIFKHLSELEVDHASL